VETNSTLSYTACSGTAELEMWSLALFVE